MTAPLKEKGNKIGAILFCQNGKLNFKPREGKARDLSTFSSTLPKNCGGYLSLKSYDTSKRRYFDVIVVNFELPILPRRKWRE